MKISARTGFGILATLVYFGLIAWIRAPFSLNTLATIPINELGDAMAGFVGPVALLWLVLGYFQQGDELRQNGAALHLQAEELKNAVEQHKEMVKATREQLQHAKNVRAEENRPHFIVNKCLALASGTSSTAVVLLRLEKGASVGLRVSSSPPVAPLLVGPDILRKDDVVKITWQDGGHNSLKLRLEFQDENENSYNQTLVMRRANTGVWGFKSNEYDA